MKQLWAEIKKRILRGAKKYGKLLHVEDIDILPWTVEKTVKWILVKSFWYVKFFRYGCIGRGAKRLAQHGRVAS